MTEIPNESSKRSLTVLAVVVACFAVLWPKIFYPMILSILFPFDNEEDIQDEIRKLDFYDMINPQMREAMGETRPLDKPLKEGNKALFHPSVKYTSKPQSKGAGAVNLVIPVYTIAIILFFIYSLLKMTLKKNQETCHPFNVKQRSLNEHKCTEIEDPLNKRKESPQERKAQRALEQYGKDKVLTALKTIILEMEDFKVNINEKDEKQSSTINLEGIQAFKFPPTIE